MLSTKNGYYKLMSEEKPKTYKEILQNIQRMNPAQKKRLALKGNITERKILINDPSLEVKIAVIQSPKCTEGEIERIAGAASTPEVVLKTICSSAKWLKSGRIKLACLKNPRLPISTANKFLRAIDKHQLRKISKQHIFPKNIRDLASKILSR